MDISVSMEPFSGDGKLFGSIVRHDTYRDALNQLQQPPLPRNVESLLSQLGAEEVHRHTSTMITFSGIPPENMNEVYAISTRPVVRCGHCAGKYDAAKSCSYCHGTGRN